mgnify:CR=1
TQYGPVGKLAISDLAILLLYVVFERGVREYVFFSFTYSEYSLVSLTQLMTLTRIPHSQEYDSNVTKYLTRASRSNTGTS